MGPEARHTLLGIRVKKPIYFWYHFAALSIYTPLFSPRLFFLIRLGIAFFSCSCGPFVNLFPCFALVRGPLPAMKLGTLRLSGRKESQCLTRMS